MSPFPDLEDDEQKSEHIQEEKAEQLDSEVNNIQLNKSIHLSNKKIICTSIMFEKNDKFSIERSLNLLSSLSPLEPIYRFKTLAKPSSSDFFVLLNQKEQETHLIEMVNLKRESSEILASPVGAYPFSSKGIKIIKSNAHESTILWSEDKLDVSRSLPEEQYATQINNLGGRQSRRVFTGNAPELENLGNMEEQTKRIFFKFFELLSKSLSHSQENNEDGRFEFRDQYQIELGQINQLFRSSSGIKSAQNILTALFEEKSRSLWKAIRYQTEDLEIVLRREQEGDYIDTITLELTEKRKILSAFITFYEMFGLQAENLLGQVTHMDLILESLLNIRKRFKSLYTDEILWTMDDSEAAPLNEDLKEFMITCKKMFLAEMNGVEASEVNKKLNLNIDSFYTYFVNYHRILKQFNVNIRQLSVQSTPGISEEKPPNLVTQVVHFLNGIFYEQMCDIKDRIDLVNKHNEEKKPVYERAVFVIEEVSAFLEFMVGVFVMDSTSFKDAFGRFVENFIDLKIIFAEFAGRNWRDADLEIPDRLKLYDCLMRCMGGRYTFQKALEFSDRGCIFDVYIHGDVELEYVMEHLKEDADLKNIFIAGARKKINDMQASFVVRRRCLEVLSLEKAEAPKERENPVFAIWKEFDEMVESFENVDKDEKGVQINEEESQEGSKNVETLNA